MPLREKDEVRGGSVGLAAWRSLSLAREASADQRGGSQTGARQRGGQEEEATEYTISLEKSGCAGKERSSWEVEADAGAKKGILKRRDAGGGPRACSSCPPTGKVFPSSLCVHGLPQGFAPPPTETQFSFTFWFVSEAF